MMREWARYLFLPHLDQGVAGYIQPERYVMPTDITTRNQWKSGSPLKKRKKIRGRRRTVPLCCQNRLKTLAYGVPFQQQGKKLLSFVEYPIKFPFKRCPDKTE